LLKCDILPIELSSSLCTLYVSFFLDILTYHSIITPAFGSCINYLAQWLGRYTHDVKRVWYDETGVKASYSVVEPLAPSFPSNVLDDEDGGASCHAGIVGLRGGPVPTVGRGEDPGVCKPSAPLEPARDVSKSVFTDLSSCWSSVYEVAWASVTLSNIFRGCQ